MERWKHLETVALEFEQFGRMEEREKFSKQVTSMEIKLEAALKRASEAERALKLESQKNERLSQEVAKLLLVEREVAKLGRRVIALNLSLLGGREGLLLACDQGDVKSASSFLEPVYISSEDDATIREIQNEALRIAASGDFLDLCEVLFRRGADPSSQDPGNGQNAIHRAVSAPGQDDRILLMFLRDDNVKRHINDADASGATPLTLAVQLYRMDRMMCLISHGADASLVPREDWKRFNDYQAQQIRDTTRRSANVSGVTSPSVASCKSSPSPASERRRGLFEATNSQPKVILSPSPKNEGSPSFNKQTPENLSERASELYRSERFEEAFLVYVSLETLTAEWSKQNRAMLFYNTARTAAKLHRHLDAAEWCDKALAEFPNFKDALAQRADSKMHLYDFSRAAIDYETLARLSPDEEDEWLRLAERARIFLHRTENYYTVLDVDPTCDERAVHRAFLKKSLRWHPDKNRGSRDDEQRATFMMQALTEAKTVLEDSLKRAQYDAMRAHHTAEGYSASFSDQDEPDNGETSEIHQAGKSGSFTHYHESDDGLSDFGEMNEEGICTEDERDEENHRLKQTSPYVSSDAACQYSYGSGMSQTPRKREGVHFFQPVSSPGNVARAEAGGRWRCNSE